jgi:SAM-dependent methyltransferase
VDADPGQKGSYVTADGYDLPFARESFDLVVCIGVLQVLSRPLDLLEEILRVLRPRGVVVVEALNAFELPAMARRLAEIVLGRPRRVRAYPVFRIRRWLEAREVQLLRRVGVYLPPRRLPALGRCFDRASVGGLLERLPGVSPLLAHAFWLVGQKT